MPSLFQTSTEEQQKFLRSTVPTGTAGAAEIAGLPTSSLPPSPAGFNVNMPEITSANELFKATQSPFTTEDTKKLLGDLRSSQLRTAELLKPTGREQQLQQQIGTLQGGLEADVQTLGFRPGVDFFTFGRGVSQAERETNIRLAPLQRQLGLEQQQRQAELQGEQFLGQAAQQQLTLARGFEQDALQRQQLVLQQVNQLRDDARNAFNTIVTNFGGLAFEDLDPTTRQQLDTLARNTGIPPGLLKEGMKTVKDRQLAQQAATQAATQGQRDIQNEISLARLGIDQARLDLARQKAQGAGVSDALLGAVVANPDLFNSLTPKTKEALLPALTELGVIIPKKLGAEQERQKKSAESAITSLDVLQNAFDQDPSIFRKESLSPFGIGFRSIRTAKDNAKDVITRLRTGAALNESEVSFYKGFVPGVFDTPEDAQFKLNTLKQFYQLFTANPGQTFPEIKKKLAEQLQSGEILIQNKQTGGFEALPAKEYDPKLHFKLTF